MASQNLVTTWLVDFNMAETFDHKEIFLLSLANLREKVISYVDIFEDNSHAYLKMQGFGDILNPKEIWKDMTGHFDRAPSVPWHDLSPLGLSPFITDGTVIPVVSFVLTMRYYESSIWESNHHLMSGAREWLNKNKRLCSVSATLTMLLPTNEKP